MILLFDTNILLDILEERQPFFEDSYKSLDIAIALDAQCIFSASSVKDIYYVIRKNTGSRLQAKTAITKLLLLVSVCDTIAADIHVAHNFSMPDFEDAVLAATAQREMADYIITRNTGDFTGSPVPAISPKNFIAKMETKK
jgi:predicted nucleic acid-binding protein